MQTAFLGIFFNTKSRILSRFWVEFNLNQCKNGWISELEAGLNSDELMGWMLISSWESLQQEAHEAKPDPLTLTASSLYLTPPAFAKIPLSLTVSLFKLNWGENIRQNCGSSG